MDPSPWADEALQQFDAVVQASAGFRPRAGQRSMAAQVAHTFSQATLGKAEGSEAPERAIAVVQAGTGVGKSLAYSVPAIAVALARGTRVLISTATVALQEQLVHKDLPALARHMSQPFAFGSAFNNAWQVGYTEAAPIAVLHHAQVGCDGSKSIVGNFGFGGSDYRQQGRFASIGKTHQSNIGQHF